MRGAQAEGDSAGLGGGTRGPPASRRPAREVPAGFLRKRRAVRAVDTLTLMGDGAPEVACLLSF